MIDFLKGTVGKDYFSSAWVGWELELNGRLKELPSIPCINFNSICFLPEIYYHANRIKDIIY